MTAVRALRMGDPLDEETDMGTVVSPEQQARIDEFLAIGAATPGARAIACGVRPGSIRRCSPCPPSSSAFPPTAR